jgi:tyrosine phenol-lyase
VLKTIIEPFRIKSVEPIRSSTPDERRAWLREAHWNLFLVPAERVMIDLLTDSGTSAMSAEQWAGMMRSDESYAGSRSFYRFREAVEELTGFSSVLPTHQGRASERLLCELLLGPGPAGRGKVVPNNAHFDTTRANIEHTGAEAVDLLTPAGTRPDAVAPFKGDVDVARLEALLEARGQDVPFVMVTVTCNTNGGQPVSLANLRAVRAVCDRHRKPLILDACRFAENAWLIHEREPGQQERPVRAIVREMFDLADGATMSAKKDGLVNIGGLLLLRDRALFEQASALLILTEGYVTYGGLAARDLEAMAQGFREVTDEDYLRYRVRSIEYLGQGLQAAGLRIVVPTGGHAVYLDAAALCPHIPAARFPGQAVACTLYELGGIRSCEIGSAMLDQAARMQLVRLAVPRRTYTQSHIDYVIEVAQQLVEAAPRLQGYEITWQPPQLRHFTARFRPAV